MLKIYSYIYSFDDKSDKPYTIKVTLYHIKYQKPKKKINNFCFERALSFDYMNIVLDTVVKYTLASTRYSQALSLINLKAGI